jgi:BirA family biotin operon repressor/biotin-[acetyl-CoA-carboxylase] ligase
LIVPSFYFFDSLPSTMDEARKYAMNGAQEGTVIIAREQSDGRGMRGRVWESSKGNLFLTYITYLPVTLAKAPQMSFVACVAVGEALLPLLPPINSLSYKWPNDILLNHKKVGGLLLESVVIPNKTGVCCLIGCGLNITSLPQKVQYPATSLHDEGIFLSFEDVLTAVVSSFEQYITLWKMKGFSAIHGLWMEGAANLGKKITIDLQGKAYEGLFKGIDQEGTALLHTSDGLIKFTAGEVLWGETHASRH